MAGLAAILEIMQVIEGPAGGLMRDAQRTVVIDCHRKALVLHRALADDQVLV